MDQEPNNPSRIVFSSNEDSSSEPRRRRINPWISNAWGLLKFVLAVAVMVFVINAFGFQSYEVFGQSMYPTLNTGDRLLISKLEKTIASVGSNDYQPERGDIVVFHDPRSDTMQLIKRVIGLPGERVVLQDGILTIYNEDIPTGFEPDNQFDVDFLYTAGYVDRVVPEGEIFVVGDNRQQGGSLDSRNELGTIPLDKVVGRLVLRIYPIGQASVF